MTDGSANAERNSYRILTPLSLSVALIVVITGVIYTSNARRQTDSAFPAHAMITGKLRVSYTLTTARTATSEEAIGSTVDASSIQFFPAYVLVDTTPDTTVLWAVDRLKTLHVTRAESETSARGK